MVEDINKYKDIVEDEATWRLFVIEKLISMENRVSRMEAVYKIMGAIITVILSALGVNVAGGAVS